ncbi:hypothetical protein V1478_000294 [Vespula squamosa]|uniref:Uncharacterized protein n=1 Tax=Vespula squamosa TaxID=30214 RepID=A0ABD2C542_VESSQ
MAFGKRPSEECETCPMINRGPVSRALAASGTLDVAPTREEAGIREREKGKELVWFGSRGF